jgi:hypothetical protein
MHGYGDPKYLADTYTPRQLVLFYEETYKHELTQKADALMLTRHAYHAEKVDKLYKQLTKHVRAKQEVTPADFLRVFGGGK